jgi:two-component system, NarL family, sensor histidine kinase DesK
MQDAGKQPAGAGAAGDPLDWAEKRPSRILLVGLLGYVGAAGAGVADYTSGTGTVVGCGILIVFCGCFLAIAVWPGRLYQFQTIWTLLGVMTALTVAEAWFARGEAFYLFAVIVVPAVALLGRRAAWPVAVIAVVSLTLPLAVGSWQEGLDWGPTLSIVFTALMVLAFTEIMTTNRALHEAHVEIARLASETERNRIARDLHDLLGHSLTVITVKAGLARRLATSDPAGCVREVSEVEELSRQAIADVRAAISNYREVTLAGELARGKELLRASGVVAELPTATDGIKPTHDELFGWVVREGLTNVARHAHAAHCVVTLTPAAVEIVDDGVGGPAPCGNGLTGLRERVAAAGGTVEVGPVSPRGWRLRVSLEAVGAVRR